MFSGARYIYSIFANYNILVFKGNKVFIRNNKTNKRIIGENNDS